MLTGTSRDALRACPLPHHTEWPGMLYLQPLVDTLGVELVVAGEHSEQLPRLEVAEADDTPGRRAQSVISMLREGSWQSGSPQRGPPWPSVHTEGQESGPALTASAPTDGCLG